MTKTCTKCGKIKSHKDFAQNKSKADGLNWQCRSCQARYHKRHYQAHKSAYIAQAKARKDALRAYILPIRLKCTVRGCGESHPAVLDFHHKDPNAKEAVVAQMIKSGWSIKRVKEELKKCVVLCANCHRKLHWKLRNKSLPA